MKVAVRDSQIHGKGLFAIEDIPKATPICFLCWWHEHEMWWRVNRNGKACFIHHANDNNCTQVLNETVNQYVVETVDDIQAGKELTLDYETFPNGLMKASDFNPPLK